MRSSVRRIGNSSAVILPKPALAALGVAEGGAVEFVYEPGKITIVPAKRNWSEADLTSETDAEALGPDWTDEENRGARGCPRSQ